MSLIKDIYSPSFYNQFADLVGSVIPSFDKEKFINRIYSDDFEHKEWKERMKHTTKIFHEFMPAEFANAVKLILQIIKKLKEDKHGDGNLAYIFFPDYIESYGLNDFDNSVMAFEPITKFISCEFAVRPFILKYGDRMLSQMTIWSKHENPQVRRLSSEGSRPRLPWAMALPELKKDPAAILPILENLKSDPSESVRRSVANSMNDIAKDHPDVVIKLAAKWKGISKETDAIIKHGCRTLLKQGHLEILKHYNLESKDLLLTDFVVLTPEVEIGGQLTFSFSLKNMNQLEQVVRLEYGIYYRKANGQLSKKVFKISEKICEPGAVLNIHRNQSFKLITTRTFYTGGHQLSIIINGEEKGVKSFVII